MHRLTILLIICAGSIASAAPQKPNIILLLVDDMGYGDIAAHGNPVLKTPNFDRLHAQSLRFTDCIVSPTCAPTRCALMTGKHEFKSGVTHTIHPRNLMALDAITLPQILKQAGYDTAMFGKWHLGLEGEYVPYKRGFDLALNVPDDSQQSHFDPVLMRNGAKEQHQGYRTDILFNEAMEYIEQHKSGPFFCYLSTYTPHSPLMVPDRYTKPYVGKSAKPEFHGMVANVDENLGRLLDKLTELNIDQNTLLITMNDNGATYGVDTWNAGMRGAKVNAYYGAIRAYSFWRWPGTIQPGERDQSAAHYDVLPTLATLTGTELPDELSDTLDGFDLSPLLAEDKEDWVGRDRMHIHHSGRWQSGGAQSHKHAFCGVLYKQFHLVRQYPCLDPECGKSERGAICKLHYEYLNDPTRDGFYGAREHYRYTKPGQWSLFDLSRDQHEDEDIAGQHPDVVDHIDQSFSRWWDGLTFTDKPGDLNR